MRRTENDKAIIYRTVLRNPCIPHEPTIRQLEALLSPAKELFYGGAVGGGKSDFLLMAALQYIEEKDYDAIIFRKTYHDLMQPGGLIPRSHEWLQGKAHWNGTDKQWTFSSGNKLVFGYMQTDADKYNYQGGEYHFAGFDEVTHFSEAQYRYIFSRLRKPESSKVPVRIRSTGNPDGVGFAWVKHRFVDPGHESRPYIHSQLEDNPFLNLSDYEESLNALDPITRQKLRFGDWSARNEGEFFKVSEIEIVDDYPPAREIVRRWDLAATPENGQNDPDYTVGTKVAIVDGLLYIVDCVRGRWNFSEVNRIMRQTASQDGIKVKIRVEEEPGSSGKRNTEFLRDHLRGYDFYGVRTTGAKDVNARPVAAWVNQGKVKMLRGRWNETFLDEMMMFPNVAHDDQVDTLSGGFLDLSHIHFDMPVMPSQGVGSLQQMEAF